MSKPFEITYTAPYGGIHTQLPENLIDKSFSPNLDNIILRNGEIRSRPYFRYLYRNPGSLGISIMGITSFVSNGGGLHTVLFTNTNTYEIKPSSFIGGQVLNSMPWTAISNGLNAIYTPPAYQVSRGVLYVTCGTNPGSAAGHVAAWDGLAAAFITDVAFTGSTYPPPNTATIYSGYFIGEMAGHLILAFTVEGSPSSPPYNVYPQRIRWSSTPFNIWGTSLPPLGFGNGLGTAGATFDGTINPTAGVADITGASDWITGMMLMGQVGYIFRQQGITQISPTGNGAAPFELDHLWASKNGIGNVHFFSIAQYGSVGVFISTEQIYQISPSTFNEIGGGARDLIMADLTLASSTPSAALIPGFNLGYVYLTYLLFIPMLDSNGPYIRVYAYSLEDKNWMRWTIRGAVNITSPGLAWV